MSKKIEKNKKKKHPIRTFFIILLLIIILFVILFSLKVQDNGGGIQGLLCTIFGQSVEKVNDLTSINILLLGISEDLNSKLTDTIILCSYNPQTKSATMISIPRDTFVGKNKNKAKGTDKINSLYSTDGSKKLLESISEITQINVNYYAVINTQALIEIVDIIGGVNFEVPINMNYDDPTQNLHIHLNQGLQLIDGEKAEQLLRFRHNNDNTSYPTEYGDNDYGRMKTQRNFITETIKQTLTIKNLPKTNTIINTIFNNIETNLQKDDILPYIPTLANFNTDNIYSYQLPGKSTKYNNLWFFVYNKNETKSMLENLNLTN